MRTLCVESLGGRATPSDCQTPVSSIPAPGLSFLSQTEQLDAGDVIRVGRRQGIWADHIGSSSEYFFLSFAASLRINSLSQTEVFVDEVGAVTCWDSGSGEKMYM